MIRRTLAKFRMKQGSGRVPLPSYTYRLYVEENVLACGTDCEHCEKYYIKVIEQRGHSRKQMKYNVSAAEVQQQFLPLKNFTIPVVSGCPDIYEQIYDGDFFELTIEDDGVSIVVDWYGICPQGCETLDEFVKWMRNKCVNA